jgi:hypothetical protein
MKTPLLFLLLLGLVPVLQAQSQKESIHKTGSFRGSPASRVLSVENIIGDVVVESYKGDQVVLEASKTITAESQALAEKGNKELQVRLVEAGDSIYVFLEAPFIQRRNGPGRNVNVNQRNKEEQYRFHVNMTLKVPEKIMLIASTVNEGQVKVSGVTGKVEARNVNGPVSLSGLKGPVTAHTVNGQIDALYATDTPPTASFKTINGKVQVYYPSRFNGLISFKSMHGEFLTDLQDLKLMPVKVVRNTDQRGSNTVYKIDKSQSYQAGKGGAELRFETLNGNIYLKKK